MRVGVFSMTSGKHSVARARTTPKARGTPPQHHRALAHRPSQPGIRRKIACGDNSWHVVATESALAIFSPEGCRAAVLVVAQARQLDATWIAMAEWRAHEATSPALMALPNLQ